MTEIVSTTDLVKTLEVIEREEREEGQSRAERRAERRLAMLPDDRICPGCGVGPILSTRSWVINRDTEEALCRRCHWANKRNAP